MLRLLWNRMSKEEKGFTLVELLVVIVILGVLAGIGVPTYRGFIERSYEAATLAELQAVSMAIKFYFIDPEHDNESFDLSKLERYLGEDFRNGKYLVYSLTWESGKDYISAKPSSNSKRKDAWIYIKENDGNRIGDIVFNNPDPSSGSDPGPS